ncbi:MAG: amidase domain-containing protein, partial [Clostridia bacterium]|nr:amidase domain-containing protein [Clostridia bacterium]
MEILDYNRELAYEYAKKWAFKRNPEFYNFNNIGGDCTNFASQCIYAG